MRRRTFIGLLSTVTWPLKLSAQQSSNKPVKIGVVSAGATLQRDLLRQSFQQLGWAEGKDILFEFRSAENQTARLPELVAELLLLRVDVIIAAGTLAPLAAKRATTTVPIVMPASGDPVGSGLVTSLSQPGGNVTGLSLMSPDLAGKRLEILRELRPDASRVGIIWNASNPYPALVFRETLRAAHLMGISLLSLDIKNPDDLEEALERASREDVSALIVVEDPLINDCKTKIIGFASAKRLPGMYGHKEYTTSGGLISYGADLADLYRRSAIYVDKILRGARPADLPIQQPNKFELVINLRTAKELGLTIPDTLLARADDVIE